jgi:hypothetical protein
LIFGNIDKYIEQLNLQSRLVLIEGKLTEANREYERLVEENELNRRQLRTQNFFRQQRGDRQRKLNDFYRRLDQQTSFFMRSLDGSRAEDIVKGWMRNPKGAPSFFYDWLEREKNRFLYSVIDAPSRWDIGLRSRILESCKQIGLGV